MSSEVRDILARLKAGLERIYGRRLVGVYLHGSYARDEADEESDLDVLIVLDRIDHYAAEIDQTGALVSELSLASGVSISRVFVSGADWRGRQTAFLANTREEAVPA